MDDTPMRVPMQRRLNPDRTDGRKTEEIPEASSIIKYYTGIRTQGRQ